MIWSIVNGMRRWLCAYAGERALWRLDERALSDIGISRSDISRVARDGYCR
jgi:uncharacterized protein YjiS (DUF1127 family)